MPAWLTVVMTAGLSALTLAGVVFWTLVSTPPANAVGQSPATVFEVSRWAWRMIRVIAAWI